MEWFDFLLDNQDNVTLLQAYNTSQNNMLILQESCIDSSGSLVVYSPVDLQSINIAMSGEDTTYIPLLPSGFTISADGRKEASMDNGIMGEGGRGAGSLVTVVFQILVSSLSSSAKMSPESVNTVNNLIGNTIHQIKAALNCSTSWSKILNLISAAAFNTEYRWEVGSWIQWGEKKKGKEILFGVSWELWMLCFFSFINTYSPGTDTMPLIHPYAPCSYCSLPKALL